MPDEEQNKGDIFGIASYGKALNTLTKGVVDGAEAFLSRICLPAAEEFGLLLQDKVSAWRKNNTIAIIIEAQKKTGRTRW